MGQSTMGKGTEVTLIHPTSKTTFISSSAILNSTWYPDNYLGPHIVNAVTNEVYGPSAPVTIKIGNGAIGPTGLIGRLCLSYLMESDLAGKIQFEWIQNTSRLSQIALQAGVVDMAFTYERDVELQGQKEGWCEIAGVLLNDHFILVGPGSDPAQLSTDTSCQDPVETMARIGSSKVMFHTRADGSTTMHRERQFFDLASVDLDQGAKEGWYKSVPCTPIEALANAEKESAYLLVDRGTFLLAKHKGIIPNMAVYLEGDHPLLMNTAVILVAPRHGGRDEVRAFTEWLLHSPTANQVIERYGTDWDSGLPLFSARNDKDVPPQSLLRSKYASPQ